MAIFLYGEGLMMRACKNFPEKNNTEEENKIKKFIVQNREI